MNASFEEVQKQVFCLGEKAGIPKNLLIICDKPFGNGTPYIEIDDDCFYCVSSERGCEFFRKKTCSLDELLYWILSTFASSIAKRYELYNRVSGQDFRRILFSKEVEILTKINLE